jgi:hypothetical protein
MNDLKHLEDELCEQVNMCPNIEAYTSRSCMIVAAEPGGNRHPKSSAIVPFRDQMYYVAHPL